jgi:uncharacterized membrane protein YwaF
VTAAAVNGDGLVIETRARTVSASAAAVSHGFVFLSPPHLAALALMFMPVLYFSREGCLRQVLFELLFFFGFGGAMQALFTPDLGMHGFPELTWKSWMRIATGTIGMSLAMHGLNQLFRFIPPYEVGNYFMMGYPPPTGSVIDVFATIFGPAPWYLAGLSLMGLVLLGILYLPYPIRRLIRRRAAVAARR